MRFIIGTVGIIGALANTAIAVTAVYGFSRSLSLAAIYAFLGGGGLRSIGCVCN